MSNAGALNEAKRIYRAYVLNKAFASNYTTSGIDRLLRNKLEEADADFSALEPDSGKTAEEIENYVTSVFAEQAIEEARKVFVSMKTPRIFAHVGEIHSEMNKMSNLCRFANVPLSALIINKTATHDEVVDEVFECVKSQSLENAGRILRKLKHVGQLENLTERDVKSFGCADLYLGSFAYARENIRGFLDFNSVLIERVPLAEAEEQIKSDIMEQLDEAHAQACLNGVRIFYSENYFPSYHKDSKRDVATKLLDAIETSVLDGDELKKIHDLRSSISKGIALDSGSDMTRKAVSAFLSAGGQYRPEVEAGLKSAVTAYLKSVTP
jgi:hypothetical protein